MTSQSTTLRFNQLTKSLQVWREGTPDNICGQNDEPLYKNRSYLLASSFGDKYLLRLYLAKRIPIMSRACGEIT